MHYFGRSTTFVIPRNLRVREAWQTFFVYMNVAAPGISLHAGMKPEGRAWVIATKVSRNFPENTSLLFWLPVNSSSSDIPLDSRSSPTRWCIPIKLNSKKIQCDVPFENSKNSLFYWSPQINLKSITILTSESILQEQLGADKEAWCRSSGMDTSRVRQRECRLSCFLLFVRFLN